MTRGAGGRAAAAVAAAAQPGAVGTAAAAWLRDLEQRRQHLRQEGAVPTACCSGSTSRSRRTRCESVHRLSASSLFFLWSLLLTQDGELGAFPKYDSRATSVQGSPVRMALIPPATGVSSRAAYSHSRVSDRAGAAIDSAWPSFPLSGQNAAAIDRPHECPGLISACWSEPGFGRGPFVSRLLQNVRCSGFLSLSWGNILSNIIATLKQRAWFL